MNELVSIIMPSYNTAKYIRDSIYSVIAQTYENWELLIVDDCSTDNTDEVVGQFQDKRIHYFKNDRNCGAAVSRNRALKEASGKWIAFLDSDDLWMPNKLEKQISFMEKNNYQFSYTDYVKIDEESSSLNIYCTGPKVVTKRKMYEYCYPGCLTVMFNVGLLNEPLQIKDINKSNDYAMWLILCKKANCYLLSESLASYRIRNHSISHDKLIKKIKSHYIMFRVCDGKCTVSSLWLSCWNMWHGFIKKIKYEMKKGAVKKRQ